MKIVIHYPPAGDADWQPLRAAFPEDAIVTVTSAEDLQRELADAEVYLTIGAWLDSALLKGARRLKWIQSLSAGMEKALAIPELRDGDIALTNARVLLGTHVAETGIALLTALSRGVHAAVRSQLRRQWDTSFDCDELTGKRALIVGTGGIGRAMARRLHGLELEVRGVDARPQETDAYLREIRPIEDLHELLPETDVLVICCPLTGATHHLVDSAACAALPDGAYLINVSRGGVVDTNALLQALRSGKLRGAGLDVIEEEPLPPEHPLWNLPNVIITPHTGGKSPLRTQRLIAFSLDNLRRYKAGQPLLNVVDKHAGF